MGDKYAEEMREMLKEMVSCPSDVFDYGSVSFGEAAEWALDTIDVQKTKIEQMEQEIERLKAEAEKAFISGQNNILEAQAEGR